MLSRGLSLRSLPGRQVSPLPGKVVDELFKGLRVKGLSSIKRLYRALLFLVHIRLAREHKLVVGT